MNSCYNNILNFMRNPNAHEQASECEP